LGDAAPSTVREPPSASHRLKGHTDLVQERWAVAVVTGTMYCNTRYIVLYEYQLGSGSMSRVSERKEYPLSMRLPEADIAIIDRAAGLRGRSRTDFVREAAVRAAEDVLMETIPIRMSQGGFDEFLRVVAGPPKPVPEMVELARRRAPWETGKRKGKS
ncbi:MAG TPA: DUF1778 domain-containing protein, partial [Lacipirellulaceae bacterium]|nr:DUF1778 domain-containing protein [Lacipirellulaceae bacterium]